MKHFFFCLLLLGSLASCSKGPTPTPTLMGEQWTLQTETTLATLKDGAAATTSNYPVTDKVTMTFLNDTRFSWDSRSSNKTGRHFEGSYTYQGQVLSFPRFCIWNMMYIEVPRTFQVTELSAHKLVIEWHMDNVDIGDGYYIPTHYVMTETYTR